MAYYLAVAIGGAIGAVSRYWMMSMVVSLSTMRFPLGTFLVNVLGSLLIGILFVVLTERSALSAEWRALLVVGYVGAFTTFSTFSLDALQLLQEGYVLQAVSYIVASVVVCMLATWLGIVAMRAI